MEKIHQGEFGSTFFFYAPPIINNNTNGTVSIAYEQQASAGAMIDNITAVSAVLEHLKTQMRDLNASPDICFNITGNTFDDQFSPLAVLLIPQI
ncbi:hypothetical protein [Patiriisocius sp. Uisw_017]|uniref:hypothetical protein n=1 Tax=Patiriisocius sp. Uisw_017 TaxID=3230968 RepID=UPI0039EB3DCA